MQIPASLSASPPAERRKHNARHRLRLLSSVHAGEGGSHSVAVLDISATGLLLETAAGLAMGERLRLDLDPAGTCNATIVWSSGRLYGCRFDTPLSKGQLGAALLRGSFVPSVPPAREELARPDEVPAQQRGGERLARLRRSRGLTQPELAALVGVSKTTVWKWKNGAAMPRRMMEVRLEEVLGTNAFVPQHDDSSTSASPGLQQGVELQAVIRSSKERIAAAAGISPDLITVQIGF